MKEAEYKVNVDLHSVLTQLRREVERRRRDNPDLSLREAYEDVIPDVFMTAAEGLDVSPFEARLLDTLERLSPFDHSQPVPTKRVCAELGIDYFALYYHLKKLEERGLVARPAGPRSGWKVA